MPKDNLQVKQISKKRAIVCPRKLVAKKFSPHQNSFANIKLFLKPSQVFINNKVLRLEENEFGFLLANAVQTVHGEFADSVDLLKFTRIDETTYQAIIKFKTVHFTRIITSLLLFGHSNGRDYRIEVIKTAQTPCFLSI